MPILRLVLFIALLHLPPAQAALHNTLLNHPSPYLAMHGQDPVHWQTWGPQAFKAAREQNKLLYVSSGYFSCHWCHVMQRESYRNKEIAAFINSNFIPVKVDRELNPALDAYLINFLENTQGYSGWPLNVFITPQGHPLLGLVYLPPGDFKALLVKLVKLDRLWQEDRQALSRDAAEGARELAGLQVRPTARTPRAHDLDNYRNSLLSQARTLGDELQGGFGEQSKFPMVPQLRALLQLYAERRDEALGSFLRLTLQQMAEQGLRDQLGGGFYRYTVDPDWQTPHFEKMLYDNAQLASLYLQAARVFDEEEYRQVALDTLAYMLRDMRHPHGGFIASLSAVDDHDVEGGYYLWQEAELKRVLSEDEYRLISAHWGVSGPRPLEAGYHATRKKTLHEVAEQYGWSEERSHGLFDSARAKLLQARAGRSLPRDEKRLAAWNALALSALLQLKDLQQRPALLEAARDTQRYLSHTLWDGKRLYRARFKTGAVEPGLEDYALVARSLIEWGQRMHDEAALRLAHQLTRQAWQRFYSDGWQLSEEAFLQYGNRDYLITDDVLPSPAAVMLENSLFLSTRFKDETLKRKAEENLSLTHNTLADEPFWYVGYLSAIEQWLAAQGSPMQVQDEYRE